MALRFGQMAVVRPTGKHSATVIFLHGLGDSGQNLSALSRSLQPRLPYVKWIFPTAPTRPVTLNGGMNMPGWFDLFNVDRLLQGSVDHEGIKASTNYLDTLVQQELDAGITNVVVGGFSQGGHVAGKYALTTKAPISGCVMLSTWLEPIPALVPEPNQKIPFFVGHGTADPLIPVTMADATNKQLQQKGIKRVDFKKYPGVPHSTSAQELDDVSDFLSGIIPDRPVKPPTEEEIDKMSIKQLRELLRSKGVDTKGFLEKSEFVSSAKGTL